MKRFGVSERFACRVLGQHRSTQRKKPRTADDEAALTADIIALAKQYGRYGYRRITALLRAAGWVVNLKRVERIWRREGLKIPHKQPKRKRLWLNDGSCIRLRPERPNHVWSYDFVEDRTHDGRRYRMLNVLDEFTHECLVIRVARKLKAIDVIDILSDLIILRGIPGHIWVRQWTGVRRRGRAKILRALQLSQMVQGVIQKLPLIRKPPAQAFGRKTAETSIQARANRPGAAGAQQKFLLFPLPARDAHDARRKRESSNSVPAYGHPIELARWGSCAETSGS